MLHAALRAQPGTLLFRTWIEAAALWNQLTRRVTRFRSLCLMPDHVHIEVPADAVPTLGHAMRAYALWRNHRRGEQGPVWRREARTSPVRSQRHAERSLRYVHLNPVRKGLVDDPLAWPFSTHRDMCGLALWPAVGLHPDPARLHAYVTSDLSAQTDRSLPFAGGALGWDRATDEQVVRAVSAISRSPTQALTKRGPARTLLVRAVATWCPRPAAHAAGVAGVERTTLWRADTRPDRALRQVAAVLGDPRFASLGGGDLRADRRWWAYRHHR